MKKKPGDLKVTLNYLKLAQDIENCMHFLKKLRDDLDIAAIKQGVKDKDES